LSKSEVAHLKQRIEEEITAMYLLINGPAVVGKHKLITHKYRNLGMYQRELARLVGEKPAERIVDETYFRMMEGNEPCQHEASLSPQHEHPQRIQETEETEDM
jgi:hypothetical protein